MQGEKTPIYLYWEPVAERIFQYHPDIQLIALLRNPIERAFSHWNMETDRGREHRPFLESVKEEWAAIQRGTHKQHRTKSYVDRGLYSKQIERYQNYFPQNQILWIDYEDFKNKQHNILQQITTFLGCADFKEKPVKKLIHKRTHRRFITSEEKEFLSKVFAEDIRKTEHLIDSDFTHWRQ